MSQAITIPNLSELKQIETLTVSVISPETKAEAEAYLILITKVERQLDKDIKALKQPYKDAITSIDESTKPWYAILTQRASTFKQALNTYNAKVREAVQAANIKALNRYEATVERKEAKAIEQGKPIPVILPPTLHVEPPKTSKTEDGSITTMQIKKWRVCTSSGHISAEDAKVLTADRTLHGAPIPLDYFVLNTAHVTKVIKAGGSIPGIEVYTEDVVSVRG